MTKNHAEYTTLPFPLERQVTIQGGRLASRKHTVRALIEVDVTEPRRRIHEHKARTVVEIEGDGRKMVLPHWMRAVNKRTFRDIHAEMRAVQARPKQTREFGVKWLGWLPEFAWDLFFWLIFKNPRWLKESFGTVGMTAVGMFGKGSGWAIPFGVHTLDIALGGISEKAGVVDGRIEIREYLCMTLSFDHDIIDGAPAARFTTRLKELIESSYGLGEQDSNVRPQVAG